MCGICGIWNSRGASGTIVRAMADQLRHRGPDDDGYFVSGEIALANRRLSIIDIAHGKQPISNETNTIHIVFNGEIYNYRALRETLIRRGHQFRTQADTEVIVHLYEEYGVDCLRHLRGMFAFAIWDESSRRLLLARDPLGQKPLYFMRSAHELVFASEVKALLKHGRISPQLNRSAMHHILSVRCAPSTATLFDGIEKLPAGHYLLLEEGALQIESYWDLQYTPKLKGSENEIVQELRRLLVDTVDCHMISDAPLGAFLSGGMDSSLVVALMARNANQPIKTFSLGCRESSFNELPFARVVAREYGTEHHEDVVQADLIGTLPTVIKFMEEPVDPYAFGVYYASRLAAKHVKVVLGGDGGDEMFAGYDRYLGNQLVDMYCILPAVLRKTVLDPLVRRLPDDFSYNNRVQKLRWIASMSRSNGAERYAQSACYLRFTHATKRRIYSDSLWSEMENDDSAERLIQFYNAANASDALDRMLYTDVKTRMAENTLMISDRMTMAHSIEGRSPLVDQKVAEFAALIPADMKIRGWRLRHIQRRVAEGLVPPELISRPKKGFGFPLSYWFQSELRPLTQILLCDGRLVSEGLFRSSGMLAMLEEHVAGKADHSYRLWLLLNLEIWYRMFIDGQPQETVEADLCEFLSPSGSAVALS